MRWTRALGQFLAVIVGLSVVGLAMEPATPLSAQAAGTDTNADWSLHNLDLGNSRYAPLDEINVSNVGNLRLNWSYAAGGVDDVSRATPLVIDGTMYFNAGSKLFALNAATGQVKWTVQVEPPFPAAGRGPTYGDGLIYAHGRAVLYAVDAKTGKLVESFGNKGRLLVVDAAMRFKNPEKDSIGYSLTAPPAYYNGTLYAGFSLSESHIPGSLLAAIDGKTGAIRWVFNTIPQGPADDGWEIAKDTWKGGARAGGGVWTQPAIDPELGLLYVNVGNPSPDYDGSARKGTNLFTNSIVALNLQTGTLAWHYQTIHHELWDFDLVSGPMLFDVTVAGRTIKGVAAAGKNCYLYLWHRDTGQPINPMVETAVPTQTDVPGEEVWPTQPFPYTAKGVPMPPFCATYPVGVSTEAAKRARPIYSPYSTKEAYIVSHGGASFGPPAFSPRTDLMYVTGKNGAIALKVKPVGDTLRQSQEGVGHFGVMAVPEQRNEDLGIPTTETVTAFHPGTGELVWQVVFPTRRSIGSAGNLATAGDLVFQGSDTGDFYAFDARSGRQLFKHTNPRSIRASPLTYRVNGKQYVTIAATNTLLTFALP